MDDSTRRAGVLLHITSLPSGTFADAAAFLDWLVAHGFSSWQVLPFGEPNAGLSPYQCASEFAINPAFLASPVGIPIHKLTRFKLDNPWLIDYALFTVIKRINQQRPWYSWDDLGKWRDSHYLDYIKEQYAPEIDTIIETQYQLHQQWNAIRALAQERDIQIIGDMPFFVGLDSVEVWKNPELFLLNPEGQAAWRAGVPPDYFSEDGQLWGNPQYDWHAMEQDGFRWWKERLHHAYTLFDWVRLDHFRALSASWMIAEGEPTAKNGFWSATPGRKLLDSVAHYERLIAEDLGIITDDVRQLKQDYQLPGMAVLQFAFDEHDDNPHKPANITPNTIAYTGTHDNDTLVGWVHALDAQEREYVSKQLGISKDTSLTDTMIDTVLASDAGIAILPLQDILGLDSEARMNTPGCVEGAWQWRVSYETLASVDAVSWKNRLGKFQR
jgi:4-alpha-glucanotransferase